MRTFQEVLEHLGITEDMVNERMAQSGVLEIALGSCKIARSDVHGNGLFANQMFAEGDWIVPVRLDDNLTHLGAVSNHGPENARLYQWPNGNMYLRALRLIAPGEEILHDYSACEWATDEEPAL